MHRTKKGPTAERLPSYLWVYSRGWVRCIPLLCGAWFWGYSLLCAFLDGRCRGPHDTWGPGRMSLCTRRRTQDREETHRKAPLLFISWNLRLLKGLLLHKGSWWVYTTSYLSWALGSIWLFRVLLGENEIIFNVLVSQPSFSTYCVPSLKSSSTKKEKRNCRVCSNLITAF